MSKLDIAEGRLSEPENMSIETSKTEEKKVWKMGKYPRTVGQLQKV